MNNTTTATNGFAETVTGISLEVLTAAAAVIILASLYITWYYSKR